MYGNIPKKSRKVHVPCYHFWEYDSMTIETGKMSRWKKQHAKLRLDDTRSNMGEKLSVQVKVMLSHFFPKNVKIFDQIQKF